MRFLFLFFQALLFTIALSASLLNDGSSWPTLLFLLLCLFSSVLAYVVFKNESTPGIPSFSWREHLLPLSLLAVGIGLRAYNLAGFSIWLDEDNQANVVTRGHDIVLSAASQQQPPIDYFFSWAALKVFGFTTWAARLPALLFGSAFLFLLYLILYRLTQSRKWSAFGLALAALNPWLIWYSQEGRPLACSLLYLGFYLLFSIDFLSQEFRRSSWINLIFVSFFYLASIGFQAPLVLISFNLAIFLVLIKTATRLTLSFHLANLIGLLMFLPFAYWIAAHSSSYLKQPRWDAVQGFWEYFRSLEFAAIHDLLIFPFPVAIGSVYLLVAGWLSGGLFLFLRRRPESAPLLRAFLLTSFLFSAIASLSFYFFVDWNLSRRYFLSLVPLFLMASVLSIDAWAQAFTPKLPRHRRLVHWIGVLVLASFVIDAVSALPIVYQTKLNREDWREIYRYLDDESEQSGAAFLFSSGAPLAWAPSGFLASDFYYSESMKNQVFLHTQRESAKTSQASLLISYLETKSAPKVFFMVHYNELSVESRTFRRLAELYPDRYKIRPFNGATVLSFRNDLGTESSIFRFLKDLERPLEEEVVNATAIEALSRFYIYKSNCQEARRYFELHAALVRGKRGGNSGITTVTTLDSDLKMACGD